jgi:hypothetical protein
VHRARKKCHCGCVNFANSDCTPHERERTHEREGDSDRLLFSFIAAAPCSTFRNFFFAVFGVGGRLEFRPGPGAARCRRQVDGRLRSAKLDAEDGAIIELRRDNNDNNNRRNSWLPRKPDYFNSTAKRNWMIKDDVEEKSIFFAWGSGREKLIRNLIKTGLGKRSW